jgi:hypothetical protein
MHLVAKQIKGREYFYLVEKERRGDRVVTARTVYIGDRQKLAELVQQSASATLPVSFDPQAVGAELALVGVAQDLGIEGRNLVVGLHKIAPLFAVERASKRAGDNAEQRGARRDAHTRPLLEELRRWVEEKREVTAAREGASSCHTRARSRPVPSVCCA